MGRTTVPAFFYGPVADVTGWAGPAGILAAQADPLGGVAAYRLQDADAAAARYRGLPLAGAALTRAGTQTLVTILAPGTAAATVVRLQDTDTPASLHTIEITWATPSLATLAGAGAAILLRLGASFYALFWTADGADPANAHEVQVFPAGLTVASQGTCFVYPRSLVVAGLALERARQWPVKAPAFERRRLTAGGFDSWDPGDRSRLTAELGWLPPSLELTPHLVSGWDSPNEAPGVNPGWEGMLRSGWAGESLTFCPDRTATDAENVGVDLLQPLPEGEPTVEDDGTKRITLVLEALAKTAFGGY